MLSCFSHVQLFVTSVHGILQARILESVAMPCPTSGALPEPGMAPASLTPPALAGRFFTTSAIWKATKR